jgi:hypothetical protein
MQRMIARTVLGAMAAAMLASTAPSFAQPGGSGSSPGEHQGRRGTGQGGGGPGARPPGMTMPAPERPDAGGAGGGRPPVIKPTPHPGAGPGTKPPGSGIRPPSRPDHGMKPPSRPGPGVMPSPGHGVRPPVRPGAGNRPAPPGYRPGFWNGRSYHYPPGFSYRRYGTGAYLPRAFWSQQFWWILDWQQWGLPTYRPDKRWVRVGTDAVLVNTRTGRIIAVRYDVFW